MQGLKNLIKTKRAKIAVIGLGYVGLPLSVAIAESGFNIFGIDKKRKRVQDLEKGESPIPDISNARLKKTIKSKRIVFTTGFKVIKNSDIIILCVPTPLTEHKEPDMSYIIEAVKDISPYLRKEQLIVLESTTYPGTTEELLKPLFESKGFEVGKDIYLAFSPERVDPGNKKYQLQDTPKIIGGITKNCTLLTKAFYKQVIKGGVYVVSSPRVAEMTKLLENIFRNVNIALVNELAVLCNKMDIDIWEVIEAAKTKPYGFMPFYPGPGVGGHCIPVDPFYLSWRAKEFSENTKFIHLSGEINEHMPQYIFNRSVELLKNHGKNIKSSKILLIGIAYKKDIADLRESPALKIAHLFEQAGANLSYYDPFIKDVVLNKKKYVSIGLGGKDLEKNDLVVILTNHSKIDYGEIEKRTKLIFDTRNVFKKGKDYTAQIYRL